MGNCALLILLLAGFAGETFGQGCIDGVSCTDPSTYCYDGEAGDEAPICIPNGYRPGNCSEFSNTCDDYANCVETDDHTAYICECVEGATGDGFDDGTGCALSFNPCTIASDCPQYGSCINGKCECDAGFEGDGFSCTDVNECEGQNNCDANAICTNFPGSYNCTCNGVLMFVGDGYTCRFMCQSSASCNPNAYCNPDGQCECFQYYEGDGQTCTDINECVNNPCHPDANCINEEPLFSCECKNGYTGDGSNCTPLPASCTDIPSVQDGAKYVIDPDFTGPANAFEVECAIVEGFVVTKVIPKDTFPIFVTTSSVVIDYGAAWADLQPLLNNAGFCYQDFSFNCDAYFALFPGMTVHDAFGSTYQNWGSWHDQKCACGELQLCDGCYCDGSNSEPQIDVGRIMDKSRLPITQLDFADVSGNTGSFQLEALICSEFPIGLPIDCHDAKFNYSVTENTPLYIDLDGRDGPSNPFMVYCDMESFPHVGITTIPTFTSDVNITSTTGVSLQYSVDFATIDALISASVYCSQTVEFQCINSPLGGANGSRVSVTSSERPLTYFPGGDSADDSCACGSVDACVQQGVECNCNVLDGEQRSDYGVIIDKNDLPVTKLTAQVAALSRYLVGSLQCSQKQFGIEPNCEKWRAVGYTESGVYYIDPDGPGGLAPFQVYCLFITHPAEGKTIVYHEYYSMTDVITLSYLQASMAQIEALKLRSTNCAQLIQVNCTTFALNLPEGSLQVIPQSSQQVMDLADVFETCDDQGCICDQLTATPLSDTGTITDMADLPIGTINATTIRNLQQSGTYSVEVGPLVCSEIFPTCADLKEFIESGVSVEGEAQANSGFYTIDPDGAGALPPFEVRCYFPQTSIPVPVPEGTVTPDPSGPVTQCFSINYKSRNGDPISNAQMDALVKASSNCYQPLTLKCQNARATGMVNFTTCDGVTQPGWAGSYGVDSCMCGINGVCAGGRDALCNCDMADDVMRQDGAIIRDMNRVPVCQVCLSIEQPPPADDGEIPFAQLNFEVGPLKCGDGRTGAYRHCYHYAQRQGSSLAELTEVEERTILIRHSTVFPVACRFYPDPAYGVMILKAKDPVVTSNETVLNITITYLTFNIEFFVEKVLNKRYCSQKVYFYCADEDDSFELGGEFGFTNFADQIGYEWLELEADGDDVNADCARNQEVCNLCGKPRGFIIPDKTYLPIKTIAVNATDVVMSVDETECFEYMMSCEHIATTSRYTHGLVIGNIFIIDPDLGGPIRPFGVECEFDKDNGHGITRVPVDDGWMDSLTFTNVTAAQEFTVQYLRASYAQILALSDISNFCWQGVQFECSSTPLVGNQLVSYYSLYGYGPAPSFGTGSDIDFQGCVCAQLGTCTPGYTCNCDAMDSSVDQGVVMEEDFLPITSVTVGGQTSSSSVNVMVTGIRCSDQTIEIPKDCAEALQMGSSNGIDYDHSSEYLISPEPGVVEPFMVRCEFDRWTGKGVTVVVTDFSWNGTAGSHNVTYMGPTDRQLQALVQVSGYCYQGVRYDCRASPFQGGLTWYSVDETARYFWGGGEPGETGAGSCACGDDMACGGFDSSSGQMSRGCNCDYNDLSPRADAGIIDIKATLPVAAFDIATSSVNANVTIGNLYCSQEPLNFDECSTGFSDCHAMADCIDRDDGYTCECKPGWRGVGVVLTPEQARANGRECFKDDMCRALNPCPYSADCNNLPNSQYSCTCKPGYAQTGPETCEDIDECADPSLSNCDVNARCENLEGSFRCICNRGFRGNGQTCSPVGSCNCFGDPHCESYDKRWLHFQGLCRYVMTQNGCGAGETSSFQVIVDHWKQGDDRPGYFSWIKSVEVLTGGSSVLMDQDKDTYVDSVRIQTFPVSGSNWLVRQDSREVILYTSDGIEVHWDGTDNVEVLVPQSMEGSLCGLCGNFDGNKTNDWTVGPACPDEEGDPADNFHEFGQSWTVDDGTCPVDCSDPPPPPPPCNHDEAAVATRCAEILDLVNSPFKNCLAAKSDEDMGELSFSCNLDICASDDYNIAVCDFAQDLAKNCLSKESLPVVGWRWDVPECPQPDCESNLVFVPCAPTVLPTCANATIDTSELCAEGCACPPDQRFENDQCIPSEQCGCYGDSGFMEAGQEVYLTDCSNILVCIGLNVTENKPIDCDDDEICTVVDGTAGCFCPDESLPVDGACPKDPCEDVDCGANAFCVEGECECDEGFDMVNGECSDGCNPSNCNGEGQICIDSNTCGCEPGFVMQSGVCKDEDECTLDTDDCGQNAECFNTVGSYTCVCCVGYIEDSCGDCVYDGETDLTNLMCCACYGAKCDEQGEVCGTNGRTYPSYRAMFVASCKAQSCDEDAEEITVSYNGDCQSTCDTVQCSGDEICQLDADNVPQCVEADSGSGSGSGSGSDDGDGFDIESGSGSMA